MPAFSRHCLALVALASAACSQTSDAISRDTEPFAAVSAGATISLLGTEPFWGVTITPLGDGYSAVYSTPDNIAGSAFAVARFAGNNGLGFSGELGGEPFVATLTPGTCSDDMSERSYPYTATVALGETTLYGCGYTSEEPFTGEETP
jgi:uncharacterized membrane protein